MGPATIRSLSRSVSAPTTSEGSLPYVVRNVDRMDKVIQIRVRSSWLYNGAVSGVGSVLTGILTGNSLTHWWV